MNTYRLFDGGFKEVLGQFPTEELARKEARRLLHDPEFLEGNEDFLIELQHLEDGLHGYEWYRIDSICLEDLSEDDSAGNEQKDGKDGKESINARNYLPGPWVAEPLQATQGNDIAICARGAVVAVVQHDPEIQTEEDPDWETVVWHPNDKLHATMLAATPDLLEALEAMHAWGKQLNWAAGPGTPMARAAAAIDRALRVRL